MAGAHHGFHAQQAVGDRVFEAFGILAERHFDATGATADRAIDLFGTLFERAGNVGAAIFQRVFETLLACVVNALQVFGAGRIGCRHTLVGAVDGVEKRAGLFLDGACQAIFAQCQRGCHFHRLVVEDFADAFAALRYHVAHVGHAAAEILLDALMTGGENGFHARDALVENTGKALRRASNGVFEAGRALVQHFGQTLVAAADGIDDGSRMTGQRVVETGLAVGQRIEQRTAAFCHDGIDTLVGATEAVGDFGGTGIERFGEFLRTTFQRAGKLAALGVEVG